MFTIQESFVGAESKRKKAISFDLRRIIESWVMRDKNEIDKIWQAERDGDNESVEFCEMLIGVHSITELRVYRSETRFEGWLSLADNSSPWICCASSWLLSGLLEARSV